MSRFYLCRVSSPGSLRKAQLLDAAQAAGVQPRPNWAQPSHRELREQLELLCEVHGYVLGGEVARPEAEGARNLYQTTKSWEITSPLGDPSVITYDAQAGEFHGRLRGSQWRALVEHLPSALARARELATISEPNAPDQLALALMDSMPAAPFVSVPGTGRRLWLIVPAERLEDVNLFHERLGLGVSDRMTVTYRPGALAERVTNSLERGRRRLRRSAGWVETCERSHDLLLKSSNSG